jgi:hypothetical protein
MIQNARMIMKRGNGAPTVPVSNDNNDGTWIATDIYEGEHYMDLDTGIVYTRSGSSLLTVVAPKGIVSRDTLNVLQDGLLDSTSIVIEIW